MSKLNGSGSGGEKKFFRSGLKRASSGSSAPPPVASSAPGWKQVLGTSKPSTSSLNRNEKNTILDVSRTSNSASTKAAGSTSASTPVVLHKPIPVKGKSESTLNSIIPSSVNIPSSKKSGFVQYVAESDDDSYDSDSESTASDEMTTGKNLQRMMVQLGSKVESRIFAKKQKLAKAFEEVLSMPSNISKFEIEQCKQRDLMVQSILSTVEGLNNKLQEITNLQKKNDEKFARMIEEYKASYLNLKKRIVESKLEQASVLTKYIKEDEKLCRQFEDEGKTFMQQSNNEISKIQRKLVLEGIKQESETVSNFHRNYIG